MRAHAAIWLLTVAAYAGLLHNGFVEFDDLSYVVDNPLVNRGLSLEGLRWAFTTGHKSNWHPLTWLSHQADVTLFGLDPAGHHATALLLHLCNASLLLWALQRLTGTRAPWPAALVAALFAVHPLHVESVAWASERKDLLCAAFFFLALGLYGRARRVTPGVAAAMALGLLSKPMLVTLPCVLLVLDAWPLRRWPGVPAWRLLVEKLPLFGLAAASSAATFVAQRSGGAVEALERTPLAARAGNALWSYLAYLGQTVWPAGLAVYYPHPGALPAPQVALAALALLALSAGALALRRRAPWVLAGWLLFLGMLVPVIGLVQVGTQARADRYTYLPHVGLFVALAWSLGPPRRAVLAAAAAALLALSALTFRQVGTWRDGETLFRHAIAVSGASFVTTHNLGVALLRKGRPAEALRVLEQAARLAPQEPDAPLNLGVALQRLGRPVEAEAQLRRALALRPEHALTHFNLGVALAAQGRMEEADRQAEHALRLDPGLARLLPRPRPDP